AEPEAKVSIGSTAGTRWAPRERQITNHIADVQLPRRDRLNRVDLRPSSAGVRVATSRRFRTLPCPAQGSRFRPTPAVPVPTQTGLFRQTGAAQRLGQHCQALLVG